jgi:hypothetical protein
MHWQQPLQRYRQQISDSCRQSLVPLLQQQVQQQQQQWTGLHWQLWLFFQQLLLRQMRMCTRRRCCHPSSSSGSNRLLCLSLRKGQWQTMRWLWRLQWC